MRFQNKNPPGTKDIFMQTGGVRGGICVKYLDFSIWKLAHLLRISNAPHYCLIRISFGSASAGCEDETKELRRRPYPRTNNVSWKPG